MDEKLKYENAVKKDECALITELVGRRLAHPLALLAQLPAQVLQRAAALT